MVNLTHEEKLLLYTYICREFPSVIEFNHLETEEGLEKALLSFLEKVKDEPWKYLKENFLEKIDKRSLIKLLERLISRMGQYWSYSSKNEVVNLLENLLQFTEEKQEKLSEKEIEVVSTVKDEKVKAVLARVAKLRAEGKIKV